MPGRGRLDLSADLTSGSLDVDDALELVDAAQRELEIVSDDERAFVAEQEQREEDLKEQLREEIKQEMRGETDRLRQEVARLEREVARLEKGLSKQLASMLHVHEEDKGHAERETRPEAEPEASAIHTPAAAAAAAPAPASSLPSQLPRSRMRSGAGELALLPQRWS